MKRYFVFAFLVGFVLLLAGCARILPVGDLYGNVQNVYTWEPIANATVTLVPVTPQIPNDPTVQSTPIPGPGTGTDPVNEEVYTTSTDVDGYFAFYGLKIGEYTLTVERPGYELYTESVYISRGDDDYIRISLCPQQMATINGIVTDGRGGPGVEGATITFGSLTTTTDYTGYFTLEIPANMPKDLFVTHEGRGTTRVQNVCVPAYETMELEIPTRPAFSPYKSFNPPAVTFDLVPGSDLSGTVTINLTIDSEEPVFVYYLYLGGEQRYPYNGFNTYNNQGTVNIDTRMYPNGESYVRFLAYDENGNAVMTRIPVYINNEGTSVNPPLDILALDIESYTFGTNIVFYSNDLNNIRTKLPIAAQNDEVVVPQTAPAGATLFNRLYWYPDFTTSDTTGYSVYRSFDGYYYTHIGDVYQVYSRTLEDGTTEYYCRYDDWSAQLKPGVTTYYKIAPFNSLGEGYPIEGYVTPLPAHSVLLQTPGNGESNVPLTPTFTWDPNWSDYPTFGVQTFSAAVIDIWDATDYIIHRETVPGDSILPTSYAYPGQLASGGIYSWDISLSLVQTLEYASPTGVSFAASLSGEYTPDMLGTGSVNGEFIFTTTPNAQ